MMWYGAESLNCVDLAGWKVELLMFFLSFSCHGVPGNSLTSSFRPEASWSRACWMWCTMQDLVLESMSVYSQERLCGTVRSSYLVACFCRYGS